ncbi:DUF4810 domain-containing protein [Zoogloea sp. LCSB751]|uniref:DUF4810 domain-containing protein n=1 Tax=Zoogloea sp. LCSB751 TaxID=1965277 RepID=UPI0020B10D93|nr:DUF4810 domain-containing protein [Zoogloea sp. LCSB751]
MIRADALAMYRLYRSGLLAAAVLTAALTTGCANRPQSVYYWGDYQPQVYTYFKGEKGPEDQIQALEATREKAAAQGKPLPPGFQAHLAMLYGQSGRADRMKQNLEAEKQQFPESTTFMDFLLKKVSP